MNVLILCDYFAKLTHLVPFNFYCKLHILGVNQESGVLSPLEEQVFFFRCWLHKSLTFLMLTNHSSSPYQLISVPFQIRIERSSVVFKSCLFIKIITTYNYLRGKIIVFWFSYLENSISCINYYFKFCL